MLVNSKVEVFVLIKCIIFFFSQISNAQDNSLIKQDSAFVKQEIQSTIKDSTVITEKPVTAPTYHNLFYFSGILAKSTNDGFMENYFKQGFGFQLGVPVFSHKYYIVRFNIAMFNFNFNSGDYLKTHELQANESIRTKILETVSFMPDVIIHPLQNVWVSPFASLGVGAIVGSKDPTVVIDGPEGPKSEVVYPFGTRFAGQLGGGCIVHASPSFNFILGAAYNFEFLENSKTKDTFYNFKAEKDLNYKYAYYSIGVQYKLKRLNK